MPSNYKNLTREAKFEYLKARCMAIFNSFTAKDFADPVTSKTILVALDNIRAELNGLLIK